MKKRIFAALAAAALTAGMLAGCVSAGETSSEASEVLAPVTSSEPSSQPEEPSESSSEVSEEIVEEPVDLGPCNPLTGETGYSEEALARRPVAVMVNNIDAALPQRGLAAADIVYEVVTESGITRLMALFADPENIPYVGPVRSARHYYVAMLAPYDPVYVHFGGSPAGKEYIANLGIDNVDGLTYSNSFYQDQWRANNRGREHSFFIDGETIASIAGNRGYETTQNLKPLMTFAEENLPVGDDALNVYVPFSYSYSAGFDYDAERGVYTKKRNGYDHIDADTNEVLTYENIFILYTSVTAYQGDSVRRDVALGGGNGWYVAEGKKYPIKWQKGDHKNQFTFTLEDGTPLETNRGKTYVCVTDSGNAASTTFVKE